jgi:succinate dehydrogenase / fumarate reductase membrane anchor subunit
MPSPAKPAQIRVMRSQLGRARGAGAARSGAGQWLAERISAVAMIPLSIWFVLAVISLLGADQPTVATWASHPLNAALLLALILTTFHHAQMGLQVVLEDYSHNHGFRTAAVLATKGAAYLLTILAALSVAKLYLTVH